MPNTDNQSKFNKVKLLYQKKLLNITIQDGFRKTKNIERHYESELNFFLQQPERTRSQKQIKDEALDFIELYVHQIDTVNIRDKKQTLKKKLSALTSSTQHTNIARAGEKENTKTLELTSRVTVLGNIELPPGTSSLLSKGPNFAISKNSPSALKDKLYKAEIELERHAFGTRWVKEISKTKDVTVPDNDFKLRNPEKAKKQPPALPTHMEEQTLVDMKVQILEEYRKVIRTPPSPSESNINKEERAALKHLKERKDLIVKQSDKDKQFVVCSKDLYIEKVEEMLEDKNTYCKVTKNPLPTMVREIEEICSHLYAKYPKLSEETTPYLPRLPEFYCLFKTHKAQNPPPLRPVTSQIDSPAERLGAVANHILQQALQFVPTHLKDSNQLKERLKTKYQNKINNNYVVATADVKSLYTNVPLKHGVKVVSQFIKKHIKNINMLGLSFEDFVLILTTVTNAGFFRFDDSYYQQIDGLGMGVKAAPPFAIIYVYLTVEKPLLEHDFEYCLVDLPKPFAIVTPESWDRYVDDCLLLLKGGEDDITALFAYVNRLNPHIQFTFEFSKEKIDFLDLTLHLDQETASIEYELFIKPTSLGIFLNYTSSHPKSTILNTATNELCRALKCGSTELYKQNGVVKIKAMLRSNNYPEEVLLQLYNKAITRTSSTTEKPPAKKYYLTLPYINEQHKRKVHQILRNNNYLESTRVCFKNDPNLKETLSRSALRVTPCNKQNDSKCYQCDEYCMKKNITYKLTCNTCQEEYIGETGRFKRKRCWEHFKSVQDRNKTTAMGNHYLTKHHGMTIPAEPFMFEVQDSCKDYPDRQIKQSYFIKHLSPAINTQLSDEADAWIKHTWHLM